MAAKTPFLTTDVGNATEIIEWSGGGRLLPTRKDENGYSWADIQGSAAVLEEIVYNEAEREVMKQSGYYAWKERFTWENITKEYEKLYFSLLENKSRRLL